MLLASERGDMEMVKLLIAAGGDPRVRRRRVRAMRPKAAVAE